jgi:Flp pilus assembly pilin Flp
VLIVFWIIGIISTPGTSGAPFMSGVGTGIKWTFTQLGVLIKAL